MEIESMKDIIAELEAAQSPYAQRIKDALNMDRGWGKGHEVYCIRKYSCSWHHSPNDIVLKILCIGEITDINYECGYYIITPKWISYAPETIKDWEVGKEIKVWFSDTSWKDIKEIE